MSALSRIRRRLPAVALGLATLFAGGVANAVVNVGEDIEVGGFLKSQNAFREAKFLDPQLVMQRNTAQFEGKYYFLKDGEAFHSLDTGWLEEATLTVIGRAAYDSVFDVRSRYDHLPGDDNTEATIREAYLDLLLPPFTLRLGRQQVVWGETDNFRALDIINPLDVRWHWSLEGWEDIRIPLWMARAIYDIGKLGPLEETFLETVYVPRDFQPTRVATDPRRPWAVYGAGLPEVANTAIIGGTVYDLDLQVRDRRPHDAAGNWQGGFRFKGVYRDVDFSLNYYRGFSASPGVRLRNDLAAINGSVLRTVLDQVYPRTNVFGFTANYTDEKFTQSVYRLETTYTTGVPVQISPLADADGFDTVDQSVVMLAVDRPTWIRSLNELRTFFLTMQIFWRRYMEHSPYFEGVPAVEQAVLNGQPLPGRFVGVNHNTLDRNEFVVTFAASTTYGRSGKIKPQFVFAFDPRSTGAYNQIGVQYLWTQHVILELKQHLYWRMNGREQGPWSIGDLFSRPGDRRNETVLGVTLQF